MYRAADVIDLHVDTFIWTRIFGYDISKRHDAGPFPGWFARQVDVPRLRDVGVTGATWVITTNPFRTADGRAHAFTRNLDRLRADLARNPDVAVVRNAVEYRAVRAEGKHGAFIGIQGGNALDRNASANCRKRRRRPPMALTTAGSGAGRYDTPGIGNRLPSPGLCDWWPHCRFSVSRKHPKPCR